MVWAFIALVGSLLIARYLTGWITVGIQGALDRAEAIARGDLTGKEITVSSKDELGDLATAFNTMQDRLRNMITSVAENAQRVANASEELPPLKPRAREKQEKDLPW
jgi:methyl-accepting chemotaxis protein